jgi:hypothetical protein
LDRILEYNCVILRPELPQVGRRPRSRPSGQFHRWPAEYITQTDSLILPSVHQDRLPHSSNQPLKEEKRMHIDRKRAAGPVASRTVKSMLRTRQNASASPSSGSQSSNDGGSYNYVTTVVVSVVVYELVQVINFSGCGGCDHHPGRGKYHLDILATKASRRESSQAPTQVPTQ